MSAVDGLREVCRCGHDKATHHEGKFNCLGMFCNDCKAYVNEWDEAPATERMPASEKKSEPPTWSFNWPLKWP